MLREFYIFGENETIYPIDKELIWKASALAEKAGFSFLRGADLIYASIAHLEDAFLVTKDRDFEKVRSFIKLINLNDSLHSANYRDILT